MARKAPGSGGMPPRIFFNSKVSEMDSGAL